MPSLSSCRERTYKKGKEGNIR